jgi:hypothetical protein
LFGREKNTDGSAVGLMISLAGVYYGNSRVTKHICTHTTHTWSSNQSGGGVTLALSSFLNQIPHKKEPEISVGVFSRT